MACLNHFCAFYVIYENLNSVYRLQSILKDHYMCKLESVMAYKNNTIKAIM